MRNWAGNIEFGAARVDAPRSTAEVQRAVARAEHVRALGSGHSFNGIADTTGDMVSVAQLPRVADVDTVNRALRVSAGLRYGDLGQELAKAGLAVSNTASLPHISIAGACATATHGAGAGNPVLAAAVRSLDLVTADGDLLTIDRQSAGESFDAYPVSLGRLGVVVEMVLDLVPAFDVAQTVVEDIEEDAAGDALPAILAAAYSVSVCTDWRPDRTARVWVREQVGREGAWSGAPLWGGRLADVPRHPVRGMSAGNTTAQLGVPGPWLERLPYFRLDFTPSTGDELQSDYVLPAEQAQAAWSALAALRDVVAPVLQVCEVRALAADRLWLSPSAGRPSVSFHFTWHPETDAVLPVVAAVEAALRPLGARPHWGKVFAMPGDVVCRSYERMGDFRRLVRELDPAGKFGNPLVDACIGLPARC